MHSMCIETLIDMSSTLLFALPLTFSVTSMVKKWPFFISKALFLFTFQNLIVPKYHFSAVYLILLFEIKFYTSLIFFRRGAIVTTFIVCYALTSFVSGYVSGGMYSRHGGMVYPIVLYVLYIISYSII